MQMKARGVPPVCAPFAWAGIVVVVMFLSLAAAASAEPVTDSVRGRCEIRFFVASTKRDFSGAAKARPFSLTRHHDASGGSEWWSASVEVPVLDLDTGYEERDNDMYWMFEAKHFPIIVAEFPRIPSDTYQGKSLDQAAPLDFRLTIRDVTRPISAKVSNWVRSGDRISFDAEFDVSASSFKLHVPTLLGFLRVEDVVIVRAHVELEGLPEI